MTLADVSPSVSRWRNAVFVIFAATGIAYSSWVTRTPDIRASLGVTTSVMGWIIFGLSAGAIAGLLLAGRLVGRHGARRMIAVGGTLTGTGIMVTGVGAVAPSPALVFAGLAITGGGFGLGEVGLNVEGAALERVLDRSVVPTLHGAFSVGTLVGAALGTAAAWAAVPVLVHLGVLGAAAIAACGYGISRLPDATGKEPVVHGRPAADAGPRQVVWRETRTLLIGFIVLGMAFAEGAASDWLPLAIVDGYGADPATASLSYGVFVAFMTASRLLGGRLVDRFGRVVVLRVAATLAFAGTSLVIVAGAQAPAMIGCALWGAGAALGFPLGISAAGDTQNHAAMRVSAVAILGYTAFLVGPPLLGCLGSTSDCCGRSTWCSWGWRQPQPCPVRSPQAVEVR
ncbi:MFS transporter [Nonomuraea recticatena]|uniref:MFS transporter n=1 Tax=Nonomuraea recticatena TaxID=46178 RepID=UPI00360A58B7